jgi:hypothetical protein
MHTVYSSFIDTRGSTERGKIRFAKVILNILLYDNRLYVGPQARVSTSYGNSPRVSQLITGRICRAES